MKNLYVETFVHYAEKGDAEGNLEYFVGTPDEAFNKIADESLCFDGLKCYKDEDEDGNIIYYTEKELREIAREYIENGEGMNNTFDDEEFINFGDLYYGQTTYGYKLVKENITEDEIKFLKKLKIIK